jgi:beta-galactosidase/beta-glucuronidase
MLFAVLALIAVPTTETSILPLDGSWSITAGDPGKRSAEWRPVTVPDAFESALGDDYDGVATYRLDFVLPTSISGDRYFLEFDAVATEAHVFVNGSFIAKHLGGWTSFRCDVTKQLRKGHPNTLQVVVDEKVGHDTQGFLPIVQPHFGGIWQSVRLVGENDSCFDEARVLTFGDYHSRKLVVEAPLLAEANTARIAVEIDLGDRKVRQEITQTRTEIDVGEVTPWQPLQPKLYPVKLFLLGKNDVVLDTIERSVGFRTLVADGRRLLLNGTPLNVRGILEWGYYPPSRTPNREVEAFERQIQEARARGFNLIKFCLWAPPKRLLDAMDRHGMLAWIEYPTWHPSFSEETRADLFAEFDEFFHPRSVVRVRDRAQPHL